MSNDINSNHLVKDTEKISILDLEPIIQDIIFGTKQRNQAKLQRNKKL